MGVDNNGEIWVTNVMTNGEAIRKIGSKGRPKKERMKRTAKKRDEGTGEGNIKRYVTASEREDERKRDAPCNADDTCARICFVMRR